MLTQKVICCLLVVYSTCSMVGHHCITVHAVVTRTYAIYWWKWKELMWMLSIWWVHVWPQISEQKLSIWKMCVHVHSIISNHLYCVTLCCVHLSHGCGCALRGVVVWVEGCGCVGGGVWVGGCAIVPVTSCIIYDLYNSIIEYNNFLCLGGQNPRGIW